MRDMVCPLSSLLAVQLDDELLGHGDLDVVAERQAAHGPLLLVGLEREPLGHLAATRVQVVVQTRPELRDRPELDHVTHLHKIRRHGDLPAVHLEVAVRDHLPALATRGREPEPVHHVVEPELEQPEQVLARHALLRLGPLEVLSELTLEHAVDSLGLLLLAKLHAERRELATVETVLARWIVASLDGALVGEAARTLEEELHPLTSAKPARHVADRGDLEAHRLERADRGLTAGPGPTHEDLDLLEPVLHRLARGDLRGRLRGEGRALARPPKAGAPGARPG